MFWLIGGREFVQSLRISRDTRYMHLFISPWTIGFVLLTLFPIGMSLYYGFTNYDIASVPQFIGLKNYVQLFQDPLFWQSLKVTGIYTFVSVPFGLILSFFVAVLVNIKMPGQRVFRTAIYFPTLISGVSMSLLWMWLLNPQFGIINDMIYSLFGVQGPNWLFDTHWVLPALIFMTVWGLGANMVLYLAALQGVPREHYEAAQIDGAGRWKQMLYISIPGVSPTTLFLLITNLIGTSQVFTQASVMTQGGPNYASYFYVYYLYQQAFSAFNMGYASAMSWILLVIVLFLTYLLMKTSRWWVHY